MKYFNLLYLLFLSSCSFKKKIRTDFLNLDSNSTQNSLFNNISELKTINNSIEPVYYFTALLATVLLLNIIIHLINKK
jgi:hypothetical protein